MEKTEQAKLGMFGGVFSILTKNIEKLKKIKVLETKTEQLGTVITNINEKEKTFQESAAGKTDSKNETLNKMISLTTEIAGGVYAYAADNKDMETAAIVDFAEYELKKMRQTDIPVKVSSVASLAEKFAADLTDYGVETNETTELKKLLAEYNTKMSNKQVGYTEQSTARETLTALFKQGDVLLESIDKLMLRFRDNEPELYIAYKDAREITDKASVKKPKEQETAPKM